MSPNALQSPTKYERKLTHFDLYKCIVCFFNVSAFVADKDTCISFKTILCHEAQCKESAIVQVRPTDLRGPVVLYNAAQSLGSKCSG